MNRNRCEKGCNYCNCLLTAPFRIIGTALANFGENMELISRIEEGKRLRAKRTESETQRKYNGTRVVGVAQKIYKHWWHNKPNFWLLADNIRDNYFRMAKEELVADPNCWNIFAVMKGSVLNLPLHLIAYFVRQINERAGFSHKWHCRLYHWDVVLSRNWCAVPYVKILSAEAC